VVVVLLAPILPAQPVRASFSCTDVHIIWARGANDAIGGIDWARFVATDLRNRILAPTTQSDYQLGNPGYNGFVYQPVDTGQTIADAQAAVGAYPGSVSAG